MTDDLVKRLRRDAGAYRQSLAAPDTDDMWSLAYQWQDKKHRHVFDLCKELEMAADRIEKLEAELHSCFHRIEELQAALREITESARLVGDYYHVKIARKALEGKDD